MTSAELQIVIRARDQASAALSKVARSAKSTSDSLKATGASLQAVGRQAGMAAAIGAGAITLLVKSAAEFDKAMREVNTLVGLSEEQMGHMRDEVKALSIEMGIDAVEASNALYQAISAGQEPTEALEFLRIAAKAAVGGVTDLETAVDGLTSIMNAWGMQSDQATRVADVMFTVVKGGKTTMDELSSSIFQIAPIAAVTGVSLEEVGAAAATLTKQGIPTKIAMTGLRMAVVSLQKPTAEMTSLLQTLGYHSGTAAIDALGLQGTFQALATETGATQEQLVKAVGSVESLQAVFGITGLQAAEFGRQMDAVKNATGASQAAFDEMAQSASFQMAQARQAIEGLRREIGEVLMPIVVSLLGHVKNLIGPIIAWIKQNQEISRTVALVGVALVGLAAAISAVTLTAGLLTGALGIMIGVIAKVTILTKAWTVAQWFLNVALGANPIGAVIVLIGALVAALTTLVGWMIWARVRTEETTEATKDYSDAVGEANLVIRERIAAFEALADAEAEAAEATRIHLENQIRWSKDALAAAEELRAAAGDASAAYVQYLDDLVATATAELELAERVSAVKKEIANRDMVGLRNTLDAEQALHQAHIETYITGLRRQAERENRIRQSRLGNFQTHAQRAAEVDQYWYDVRLAARKRLFAEYDILREADAVAEAAAARASAERAEEADQRNLQIGMVTAQEFFEYRTRKRDEARHEAVRIAEEEAAAVAAVELHSLELIARGEADILARRVVTTAEFTAYRTRMVEAQEVAELRLKKVTVGLAAEERTRMMALIAPAQMTVAGAKSSRALAWEAMAAGAREEGARLRAAARALGMTASEYKRAFPDYKERFRTGRVPGWAPAGAGPPGMAAFTPGPGAIAGEMSRLYERGQEMPLTMGERAYVQSALRAAGMTFNFPNYVGDQRDLEEAIMRALTEFERRGRLRAGTTQ